MTIRIRSACQFFWWTLLESLCKTTGRQIQLKTFFLNLFYFHLLLVGSIQVWKTKKSTIDEFSPNFAELNRQDQRQTRINVDWNLFIQPALKTLQQVHFSTSCTAIKLGAKTELAQFRHVHGQEFCFCSFHFVFRIS